MADTRTALPKKTSGRRAPLGAFVGGIEEPAGRSLRRRGEVEHVLHLANLGHLAGFQSGKLTPFLVAMTGSPSK